MQALLYMPHVMALKKGNTPGGGLAFCQVRIRACQGCLVNQSALYTPVMATSMLYGVGPPEYLARGTEHGQ